MCLIRQDSQDVSCQASASCNKILEELLELLGKYGQSSRIEKCSGNSKVLVELYDLLHTSLDCGILCTVERLKLLRIKLASLTLKKHSR